VTYVHAQWGTSKHGTPAGFSRHQVLGQDACEACTAAKKAYDAEHYKRPEIKEAKRLQSLAKQRAFARLREAHPQEFGVLYEEEKAKLVANSA